MSTLSNVLITVGVFALFTAAGWALVIGPAYMIEACSKDKK